MGLSAGIAVSGILISVYLVLLCSCAGNIDQPDVWLGMLFFFFLMLVMCGLYILKKIQATNILLPLVCCFILFETRTASQTFKNLPYISGRGLSISDCIAIDNDLISQFVRADQEGEKEMILYVPDFETAENWPLGTWGGNDFPKTLYRHGIIDRPVTVTEMVPTREKNEQLNLD